MDVRLGRPYIDVHVHIGTTISRVPSVGQSSEKYLARMSQTNIVAAIPSPAAGGIQVRGLLDTQEQNDAIADACRRYPDRFPIGLGIVEVRHGPAAVEEIERCITRLGLVGLMCHPTLSGHRLGPILHPMLEVVDAHQGLALLHTPDTAAHIADYARRFGHTIFIVAHGSMRPEGHRDVIATCADIANVYVDIAQKPRSDPSWDLADLVRHIGAERILFGSDTPYYDYRLVQALIEEGPLDEGTKDRIAWRNAAELIQHFRPEWQPSWEPPACPAEYLGADLWAAQGARLR
jgi:predicted TIM-barrel fold metal-dependent hydrolase